MSAEMFALYLRDLGDLVVRQAVEAKEARLAADPVDEQYSLGRLFAYHEVVSLMQQQADAFGLDRRALGLGDIDPDRDLL
ncbi:MULTISPECIES: hypothetical protein [Arthrobacter]|uniref:Uncharacterized protein n=2 Tax=Arthrobacter TaxID=1663 RepID=A0ABU9KJ58_9MICC|nr:hypothetical protein [Arthrobacter sp. YJM1]MDP5226834.1 hypothetical protein [Arthrobacter sp. YJM1]